MTISSLKGDNQHSGSGGERTAPCDGSKHQVRIVPRRMSHRTGSRVVFLTSMVLYRPSLCMQGFVSDALTFLTKFSPRTSFSPKVHLSPGLDGPLVTESVLEAR